MRFKVVSGSESAHCCFEATVVDTSKEERDAQYNVCECFNKAIAEQIADALNKGDDGDNLCTVDGGRKVLAMALSDETLQERYGELPLLKGIERMIDDMVATDVIMDRIKRYGRDQYAAGQRDIQSRYDYPDMTGR